jgi:hypothetical protein
VLHANGAADVVLEGAATRHTMLSRDARGPRAVMNALERLAGSYGDQCETARQELALAEGQVRDYEARLGQPFAHEAYLTELTQLRDQLKAALSSASPPEPGSDQPLSAQAIAGHVQALKAAHTIEASPQRASPRHAATAEAPVTARLRRRVVAAPDPGPSVEPDAPAPPSEPLPTRQDESEPPAMPDPFHGVSEAAPARPRTAYRSASHGRRKRAR